VLNTIITRHIGRDSKAPHILNLGDLGTRGPFHGLVAFATLKSQAGCGPQPFRNRWKVRKYGYLPESNSCHSTHDGSPLCWAKSAPFLYELLRRCGCPHTCTQLSTVLRQVHDPSNKLIAVSVRRQQNILKSESEGGGKRSETRKRVKRKRPTRTCSIEPHELTKEGRCKKRRMEYL
jgi:hypothetical protein